MELEYRLPIQFSVRGKMSLFIKITLLSCTHSFEKLISPINWICERNPVQEVLATFEFDSEINHGTSKFIQFMVSPHKYSSRDSVTLILSWWFPEQSFQSADLISSPQT